MIQPMLNYLRIQDPWGARCWGAGIVVISCFVNLLSRKYYISIKIGSYHTVAT